MEFVLAIGTRQRFTFAEQKGFLRIKESKGLKTFYVKNNDWELFPFGSNIKLPLDYKGLMSVEPENNGNNKVILEYLDENEVFISEIKVFVTTPNIILNIDSNRDGMIDVNDIGKSSWVWGEFQMGAVVMINNDRDVSDFPDNKKSNSEFGKLILAPTLLDNVGDSMEINLSVVEDAARKIRVYGMSSNSETFEVILGKKIDGKIIEKSRNLNLKGETFFIEALEFPNAYFEGTIDIDAGVTVKNVFNSFDRITFRVAPWIMTPNTQKPLEVFACKIVDKNEGVNDLFLKGLSDALQKINIPLNIIPPVHHNNDRWIQDEIEFGYCQSPTHTIPVVFDSPRDRGLDGFPEAKLLNPDFGHFQIGGSTPNSLDSFGNLEVCPPITVNGKHYPFGRIIFGGKKYGDYSSNSRSMMTEIRRFLHAQKIQAPIEIFTDWLEVGHADEIITFVPYNNDLGFKLLIASPMSAEAILKELEGKGYGDTLMFEGKLREFEGSGISAEIKISNLLNDHNFWKDNFRYQTYLNHNQNILERELGIMNKDVIQVPVLFHPSGTERTAAYFPDMVNHLVLGEHSIVPKPYGPIINGKCAFEKAFEDSLPNRVFTFIDDWYSYHEMLGEVHCGTNTRRQHFDSKVWWNYLPYGGFNMLKAL